METETVKIRAFSRIRYDQIKALIEGDVIYEVGYGTHIRASLLDAPIEKEVEGWDEKTKTTSALSFYAKTEWANGDGTDITPYYLTKGLEHYGPKLYTLVEVDVPVNMAHLDMKIEA